MSSTIPGLAAVILGAGYFLGAWGIAVPVAVSVLGALSLAAGRGFIGSHPVAAAWLISGSLAIGIGVVSVAAAVLLWFSQELASLLEVVNPQRAAVAASAIAGAISGAFAVVAGKAFQEGRGSLWPSKIFQSALIEEAARRTPAPEPDSPDYHAINSHKLSDPKITGWGFRARITRAQLFAAYLKRSSIEGSVPGGTETH